MKIIFYCIFLVSFIFSDIIFYDDIQNALIKAKKENKLVYVLLSESGCPWCYAMKKRVLKNKNIQDILQKGYISVIADKDLSKIPKKFQVNFYPTSYIIDPDDTFIVQKFLGYTSANPLTKALIENFEILKK
jgi:hypothetical protein